ncbi:DNA-directed RNA polymerase III subunit C31 [Amphichorda felina]
MSRGGGRGGGRGGRGGGRGGRPNLPWDTGDEPDSRPSELFPERKVPDRRPLTAAESSTVQHFLLLRHQLHSSPLYTARRTLLHDPTTPRKMYGTEQTNALYGVRNRASQDPFTAVPTYGQRFVRQERALPDWSRRPVCNELWPRELLDVVDPEHDRGLAGGPRKRRRLEVSMVSALPNAEEAFGMLPMDGEDGYGAEGEEDGVQGRNLLERLDALGGGEGEEGAEGEEEEVLEEEEEQDEVFDDEDAGDYNAEEYFDNGDEMGDDFGDEGDGEGTF